MIFSSNQKIVLASGNQGKIREIQAILKDCSILPQSQFNVEEAEETGSTFIENAIIKARNAAQHCNLPAIADDSGLVIDALDGAPGVISARYAGDNASDYDNLLKVLENLENIPTEERRARFVCVLVFMRHANDPLPLIAQGVWEGQIMTNPAGESGFGYDPIFWVSSHQKSSAELSPDIKNTISHRGQALKFLADLIYS
ncbi:MAG: RdgB/HAM1 family non-canonical purine NTP pyrophosphatase [Methylococcales bacterium]|nr:RdgB/HAM1 family non-canonical purine NTP pyrophosphatase [Methylococcales bacterium]